MDKVELERRTKDFSLRLIRFLESLPKNYLGETMGRQLLKSGTSIGANYREANRAESKADFIHKLAIAEKEASETALLAGINGRGRHGQPGGGDPPFTGNQRTIGHIYSRRPNFQGAPVISDFEIRNSKWPEAESRFS